MLGISAGLGLPWRSLYYWLHSFTKPVEMRPIDPALSLERPLWQPHPAKAPPAELQQRHKGVPRGGAALTFSDAAPRRMAQRRQHPGGTCQKYGEQSCPPAREQMT
jgi:hypothetical protein